MKRWIIALVVGVLLVAGALAVLIFWPRPAPPAARLLSEHTLLFIQAPHPVQSRDRFRATGASALWQEPAVQAFLEVPRQFLANLANRPERRTAVAGLDRLLETIQGEGFIAVTYLRTFPAFQPGLIAGADVGRHLVETRFALATLARHLTQTQPDGRVETKSYLGVRYTVWRQRPTQVICFGCLNSLVVFTLGEDTMRDAIARFRGRAPPALRSLAESPRFQRFAAKMPAAPDLLAYLNFEPISALLSPLLAMSPQTLGVLQRFTSIEATGLTLHFQGSAVRETRLTLYRAPDRAPAPANPRRSFGLTSPATLFYTVGTAAWQPGYDQLSEAIGQFAALAPQLTGLATNAPTPDLLSKFEQRVARHGTRLRDDLLARLGPETGFLLNWRAGAEFPDFALGVALTNTPPPLAAVDALFVAAQETWFPQANLAAPEELSHRGQPLHVIRFGAGLIAPTSFVTDGLLVVASNPDFARELLDHLTARGPTLDAAPAYRRVIATLPRDFCSATYCDLAGLYAPLRLLVQERARGIVGPEFVDLARLPPPEVVGQHLTPFASTTAETPGQRLTVAESPVGTPVGLIAATLTTFTLSELLAAPGAASWPPAAPRASSDTVVPSSPPENQTAASPLPPSR